MHKAQFLVHYSSMSEDRSLILIAIANSSAKFENQKEKGL